MVPEVINNIDVIKILENSSELVKPSYKSLDFVTKYIGLYLARASFYGERKGNVISALQTNQLVFSSTEDITIVIEGVTFLNKTPINEGSGSIVFEGFGLLVVNNTIVYNGKSDGSSGLTAEDIESLLDEYYGDTSWRTGGTPVEATTKASWAVYSDTEYTDLSPLTLTASTAVNLPNNSGFVIDTYMPDGITFYDATTQKITPQTIGETYALRYSFKVNSPTNNNNIIIRLDIGGGQGVILEKTIPLRLGTNVDYRISSSNEIFALDTFIANGGQLSIEAQDANTTVWDIQYYILRNNSANVDTPSFSEISATPNVITDESREVEVEASRTLTWGDAHGTGKYYVEWMFNVVADQTITLTDFPTLITDAIGASVITGAGFFTLYFAMNHGQVISASFSESAYITDAPLATFTLDNPVKLTQDGSDVVADSSGISVWGDATSNLLETIANSADFEIRMTKDVGDILFAVQSTDNAPDSFAVLTNAGSVIQSVNAVAPSNVNTPTTLSSGEHLSLKRVSGTITVGYSTDDISYSTIHTFAGTNNDAYVINVQIKTNSGIIKNLRIL